mgnify:CR=1 FL=1
MFEIEPLNGTQIQVYVDNIIKLGKFDKSDREAFLKQNKILKIVQLLIQFDFLKHI